MIGSRTRSREIALQILYCRDVHGRNASAAAADDPADPILDMSEAPAEVRAFARELVQGVLASLEEIDAHIAATIQNWEMHRLAAVDRNILRLAVHEMLARDDIPAKVSINEGIELGKRFSTAQSGAFVNGILDQIRKALEPRDAARDPDDEPTPR